MYNIVHPDTRSGYIRMLGTAQIVDICPDIRMGIQYGTPLAANVQQISDARRPAEIPIR